MDLLNYEFLPGTVESVKDESYSGIIKASIASDVNSQNTQIDAMEDVHPFMMGGYQQFSKLEVGSKVWILRNKQNKEEMWYLPMPDFNPDTKKIINGYDNTDILISRSLSVDSSGNEDASENNSVYIYYNDSQGIVLSIGTSRININSAGDITLKTNSGFFKVSKDGKLYLNTEENTNKVAKGNEVETKFAAILKAFELLERNCMPGLTHVASQAISDSKVIDVLRNQDNDVKADNVFI